MFGLPSSNKTLTVSFVLVFSAGCVHSMREPPLPRDDISSETCIGQPKLGHMPSLPTMDSLQTRVSNSNSERQGGFWKGLGKILFGNGKRKMITFAVVIVFALAMVALFANFTGLHKEAGKMIFGDQGSSRWLRLAVAAPCLTFSVGALVVVLCRASHKGKLDETEYKEWKEETGFSLGKNKASRFLQYFYCIGLLVFAVAVAILGGQNNWGETMHMFAFGLPALAGIFGLVIVGTRHYYQNKMKKNTIAHATKFTDKTNELTGKINELTDAHGEKLLELEKANQSQLNSLAQEIEQLKAQAAADAIKFNQQKDMEAARNKASQAQNERLRKRAHEVVVQNTQLRNQKAKLEKDLQDRINEIGILELSK